MRRKIAFLVVTSSLISGGLSPDSWAQCEFNGPGTAKRLRTSMVRAYEPCGTSSVFPAPTTSTAEGVSACAPPMLRARSPGFFDVASDFYFGPKGRCDLELTARLKRSCKNMQGACLKTDIRTKCEDIRDPDGIPIDEQSGWSIRLTVRSTFDDAATGDLTVIDVPVQIAFGAPVHGTIKLRTDTVAFNQALGGFFQFLASPCSSHELLDAEIDDPFGRLFAVQGFGGRRN